MKQHKNDIKTMIKSIKANRSMDLIKYIYSDWTGQNNGFVRRLGGNFSSAARTLMLLIMMVVGAGSVSAAEKVIATLYDGGTVYYNSFTTDKFSLDYEGYVLRIYSEGGLQVQSIWNNKAIFGEINYNTSAIDYDSTNKCYNFVLSNNALTTILDNGGLYIGQGHSKVEIVDTNYDDYSAKLPETLVSREKELEKGAVSYDFNFSEVQPSSPVYARYYLVSGTKSQDITGKLIVKSGNGKRFKTNTASRGVYVYQNGTALGGDDLKGTLTMPATDLWGKKLVAVFSVNPPSVTIDDEPQHEPVLFAAYEYTFIVPSKTIDKYIKWDLSSDYFDVSDMAEQMNTTIEEMAVDFNIKWYVYDSANAEQNFTDIFGFDCGEYYNGCSPYKNQDISWQLVPYYWMSNETESSLSSDWEKYHIGTPKISCKSGTFETNKDYTIVCEAETPTGKVKYIFHFTKDGFEPDDFCDEIEDDKIENTTHKVIVTDEETVVDVSGKFAGAKYARYYLMTSDGAMCELSADAIEVADGKVTNKAKRGKYVYKAGTELTADNLKIKVMLPAGTFYDYNLVALLSDQEPITDAEGNVIHDAEISKKIVYTFIKDFVFVHSKGASGRDYITSKDDKRISGTVQQYEWKGDSYDKKVLDCNAFDPESGSTVTANGDIRQGVHTVEYDVYVDPSSSEQQILYLPFENYETGKVGSDLEPAAYIRWYDWATDTNNGRITKVGSSLKELKDGGSGVSRGFFSLYKGTLSYKPTHTDFGVTFDAAGFGENDCVTIACDVSRYNDGLHGSGDDIFMLHEPTLSTRYIFTIRHAKVIAEKIKAGEEKLKTGGVNMFELAEDNGRFCVSINANDDNLENGNSKTKFSVRANLGRLHYYYVYNDDESGFVNCENMAWVPYYEDEQGLWKYYSKYEYASESSTIKNPSTSKPRIHSFTIGDLEGYYVLVGFETTKKKVTVKSGDRVHMVGLMNEKVPVVHYEMNFINAPAYRDGNIPDERRAKFLTETMDLQAALDFDDKFKDGDSFKPLVTQRDNHLYEPLEWGEVMYGFYYPQLSKYRTYIQIDAAGISPLHGDYMLLRTMNMDGISKSVPDYPDGKYVWWNAGKLEDYTFNFGGKNKGQYGGFLYVDASDEARTIAKLKFKADLCAGSELCYTAVVADMTAGSVMPRLMTSVYAIDANGNRKQVVSFLSCELSTAAVGYAQGEWFQVYGKIAVPANIDLSEYDNYEVYIDNYADGTQGADYCVDQIMFFTKNAKVNIYQKAANCDDNKLSLNMYIDTDVINRLETGSKIYWRICDENGNPMPAELYNNGDKAYGETVITDVPETVPALGEFTDESGYFVDKSGRMYFSLANMNFALESGHQYYVSVYALGYAPTGILGDELWGKSEAKCSIFSPVFYPLRSYLSMHDGEGDLQTSIKGDCSTGKAEIHLYAKVNIPDVSEGSGFRPRGSIAFDFFLGSKTEFENYKEGELGLMNALRDYRDTYPNDKNLNSDYESTKKANYDLIKKAVDDGILLLACSDELNCTVSNDNRNIVAISVKDYISGGEDGEDLYICELFEYTFNIDASGGGPVMELGFDGVTYPDGYKRVLRVGREQLLNMQKADGCLLHVPVNTFKTDDEATEKDGALVIVGNLELVKEGTTDPKVTANVNKVATFAADEEVSASKMYVSLNFHGADVNKQNFREGFAYKMFFQVKKKGAAAGDCEGNVEFLIKVVPEFVTWNGNADNASWNNDGNWSRSKCEELYKKDGQNTPTAAQGDVTEKGGYVDNDETLGQPDTYVPMKFTYVTLPTHNRAPWLKALSKNETTKVLDVEEGATENIQYDMMVKVENECSHSGTGNIYDCETFYGNTCNEIYFKPEAELGNQQHLTYNKAWVEKELEANKWYLMATPLQATYAGDMYVPCANGRQETEAFQPINFKTDGGYSRTKYPIYQRSWGADAKVYTKTGDLRGESWSANLPYASVVEGKVAEWSHVYNDVQVPYSSMMGFSIRTHKKDQGKKTLIRLPKADVSYDYYEADGNQGDISDDRKTVSKESGAGRFITETTLPVSGVQNQQGYVLVGNPYMASMDMEKFFEKNENIEKGYWTYESNTATAQTSGVIRPLQAFFVKLKDGSASADIKFTPEMMTDGNTQNPDNPNNAPAIRMTAKSTGGQSVATLVADEGASVGYAEGEDVETLFDSNLNGVPMVYTVAGKQAVSINALPEVDVVPFGVSVSGDEMVEVSIEGTDAVDSPLYIYDAVSGETTEIAEGGTIDVQPNDYGRYYLTTRRSIDIGGDDVSDIVVSVRQNSVTVSAAGNIDSVNVLTLDGIRHKSYTEAGNTVKFTLQPGIYIIEAQSGKEKKSMKVYITV